jgi:hypothetical protein
MLLNLEEAIKYSNKWDIVSKIQKYNKYKFKKPNNNNYKRLNKYKFNKNSLNRLQIR